MEKTIKLYTLKNKNNIQAIITNYGARLVSLSVPDNCRNIEDIVLGYDNIKEIVSGNSYFGATIGRYANRIAKGKFTLEGVDNTLKTNNGENALHGGEAGYDQIVWNAEQVGNKIIMEHLDKDTHEGYPGNVEVTVTYELTDENELKITYVANTDKATPFNVTNHAFYNLKGAGKGEILDHKLMINADKFTPIDSVQIPTGEIVDVMNTPFDFTKMIAIGKNINADNENIKNGFGFDHNWIINGEEDKLKFAAKVIEPESGRTMEVYTTEPGVQLYTGNFLDGSDVGREGVGYERRSAFCLETQHFPDSPNQSHFPNTILRPGEKFNSETIYKFGLIE